MHGIPARTAALAALMSKGIPGIFSTCILD
jgi:hypothetical protein